jgi:hypothetical protein
MASIYCVCRSGFLPFLVGLLIVAYFRNHRRESIMFWIGSIAGLISFGVWLWWRVTH